MVAVLALAFGVVGGVLVWRSQTGPSVEGCVAAFKAGLHQDPGAEARFDRACNGLSNRDLEQVGRVLPGVVISEGLKAAFDGAATRRLSPRPSRRSLPPMLPGPTLPAWTRDLSDADLDAMASEICDSMGKYTPAEIRVGLDGEDEEIALAVVEAYCPELS